MSKNLAQIILQNLLYNEEYSRKVTPFLKTEYLHDKSERIDLDIAQHFILTYNTLPTKEVVLIEVDKLKSITDSDFKGINEVLENLSNEDVDMSWLVEQTENFCKDKAVYNAIMESIHIIDGESKTQNSNAIPEILSDALAVSFDTHVGHDYLEDSDDRFDFYHRVEKKVPFDLEYFNTITAGGTPQKTLNIIMAGTGVGKSLLMSHHAANCLSQTNNVLYIT